MPDRNSAGPVYISNVIKITWLFLTLGLCVPATAEVFRCGQGDNVVFTDIPCSDGDEPFRMGANLSIVAASDDLDEVAERNRSLVNERRQELAEQRRRAAERRRQAERDAGFMSEAEVIRYRPVIGGLANPGFASRRPVRTDEQSPRQDQPVENATARRRTLLSRSGGNQRTILR